MADAGIDSMSAEDAAAALAAAGIEVKGETSLEAMRSALKASFTGQVHSSLHTPTDPPAPGTHAGG